MLLLLFLIAFEASAYGLDGQIEIRTPMPPPSWALLERDLIKANAEACEIFFDRYFDDRGWLECVERWGGDDGPDDAIENLTHWPILYALGGPDSIRRLYTKGWEGHLRQYTREDRRCPDGTRGDVLQGVPRHVRLAPQRRGPHGL